MTRCMALPPVTPAMARIWALFVEPDHEGRGIGRALLPLRLCDPSERLVTPSCPTLLRSQYEELVGAGFGAPDFALASGELSYPGVAIRQRKRLELLRVGVEAQDRVGTPVADPHGIGLVDIDGVGLRTVSRQVPARPRLGLAAVAEEVAAVPAGDPEAAAAVAPHTPCALARDGRLQNRDGAGFAIDSAEIVAGERSEEDLAIRRRGDAVGAGAARRVEHRHHPRSGIEPAIDAVLPGEPKHVLSIKAGRVKVGLAPSHGAPHRAPARSDPTCRSSDRGGRACRRLAR